MSYNDDPINVRGVGSLLNQSMARPGASFVDLEENIIKREKKHHSGERKKEDKPADKFDRDLMELSTLYGINLTPNTKREDNIKREEPQRPFKQSRRAKSESSESSSESSESESSEYTSSYSGTETSGSSSYTGSSSYSESDSGSSYTTESSRRSHRRHRRGRDNYGYNNYGYNSSIPPPPPFGWQNSGGGGGNLDHMRQQQLVSAISDGPNFMLERERHAELRSSILDKIESMRQALEEEGIDCSKVDIVTSEDSDEKIEAVYRTLNSKTDRQRYCSLAEELVLAGVGGLESIFDGKRIYFGRYRPDLTDWSITVQAKLRRVRPETAMMVGAIMRDYNVSPMWRIAMELVPSAISHMRLRARRDDKSGLYNDVELSKALNEIRGSSSDD